jgi:rhamnogalacturonyl hydrolase YesR
MAFWDVSVKAPRGLEDWRESIRAACRWVAQRSMMRSVECGVAASGFSHVGRYRDWRGAFRGEYSAATRRWDVYAPIWHGGQGVKGLALAARALGEAQWLDEAEFAAEFLLRHQITDPEDEDCGLLLAYENNAINVSAIVEALDGLLVLGELSGKARYTKAAVDAARWIMRKACRTADGSVRWVYDPDARRFAPPRRLADGRLMDGGPLLDDGVFVKIHRVTGERAFLDVAVAMAQRLLADEDPPGNWASLPPNDPVTRTCHPRTAYWCGRPMWMVGQATGDERFVACARRSAQWYAKAMRLDGGLFRSTAPDFRTPSFDQATSGIACASILWLELALEFGEVQWDEHLARALRYCYGMQFTQAVDENLQGAVLEKVVHPNGSDAPPWYLRDIGTFFYIQAASRALAQRPQVLLREVAAAKADGA